ncbi:hypothetical protein BH20VER1_BH20VER1_11060 [soil metagenome]
MNPTDQTPPPERRRISYEAMVGTGVSVAAIGVLFLLLGVAQWMRAVPGAAFALLAIGAICVVIGVLTAMTRRRK